MKTNNKTQTNNTTTMVGSNTNQTNNKTTMTIKIEWTVDHWLAILPDGTKKADVNLPVLITSITGGDIEIARKIEF
jgi:hypothetical protein